MAHSIGVGFCVEAAEELAKEGISAEIINLRSIRPLDIDTINESIKKTHHLITVEGMLICISNNLLSCYEHGMLWLDISQIYKLW